jgi:hypothetical protein
MSVQVRLVGPHPSHRLRLALFALLGALGLWRLAWMGYSPIHLRPRALAHGSAVDVSGEPQQAPLEAPPRPIVVRRHGRLAVLEPVASYTIAAQVVAARAYYTDALSVVSPLDLSLIWGPVLAPRVREHLHFGHFDRHGTYRWRGEPPLSPDVLASHFSNNHLIPASRRVRAALLSVDEGDTVRLSGWLVNVSVTGGDEGSGEMNSSLTRSDTGDGACEILYVRAVQIGRDVFE